MENTDIKRCDKCGNKRFIRTFYGNQYGLTCTECGNFLLPRLWVGWSEKEMEKERVENESQKELNNSVMEYDEGFKPTYRNKKMVEISNVPSDVPQIPEEIMNEIMNDLSKNDVVAQNEQNVPMAGEPEEQIDEIVETAEEQNEQAQVEEPVQTEAAKPEKKEQSIEEMDQNRFAVTMRTDIWNQVTALFKAVKSELRFTLEKEGISVVAVDPAHVAMLVITIPRGVLAEYNVPEDSIFAIDLKNMPKLKNGNNFSISRQPNAVNREIKVSYNGIDYTVSELDIYSVNIPKIPKIDFDVDAVDATVNVQPVKEFLKVAETVSDAVKLTAHIEEKIVISATNDTNRAETVIDMENGLHRMRIRDQVIRSCYPIEYLLKILKAVTAVTEMDIHYRTDYPLELDFKLPEVVAKTKGYYETGVIPVRYLLAPRMEQ